jgi:hypothetical protein
VPLNANALCTLNAAKAFIQPGGMTSADDPRLEEVINRASSLIESWCGRPFAKATHTDRFRGPCSTDLFVSHTPIAVTQPITVTVNSIVQTVWRSEADGDPLLLTSSAQVIVMRSCSDPTFTPDMLYRAAGWGGTSYPAYVGPANVLLTYSGGFALSPTAGYPPVPSDLEEAALEVVKKIWNDQAKGLQDVTTVQMPSGSLNLFDAGLPRRAVEMLNPFRRLVVA